MTRWKCCFGKLLDRWGDTTLLHGLKVGSLRILSYPSYHSKTLPLSRPVHRSEMISPCTYCREYFCSVIRNFHSMGLVRVPPGLSQGKISVKSFWISTVWDWSASPMASLAYCRETLRSIIGYLDRMGLVRVPSDFSLLLSGLYRPPSYFLHFSSLLPNGDPLLTIHLAGVESP